MKIDAMMLKILAQENMEEMAGSPIWAMEVVKAAYFFLKEKQGVKFITGDELAQKQIVEFLAWPNHRVQDALANLRSTGEIPQAEEGAKEPQPSIKKEEPGLLAGHQLSNFLALILGSETF